MQLQKAEVTLYFLACPFIGFNIVTATYFTSTERPPPRPYSLFFERVVRACASCFPAFHSFENDRSMACLSNNRMCGCNGGNSILYFVV